MAFNNLQVHFEPSHHVSLFHRYTSVMAIGKIFWFFHFLVHFSTVHECFFPILELCQKLTLDPQNNYMKKAIPHSTFSAFVIFIWLGTLIN